MMMKQVQKQPDGENTVSEHNSDKCTGKEKEFEDSTPEAEKHSELPPAGFTYNSTSCDPYYLDISQNERNEFVAVLRRMPVGTLYFPRESLTLCENEECIYKGTLHSEADCMKYMIRTETQRTVLVHVIEPNVPLSLCHNNQCFLKGKYHFAGQCLHIQLMPMDSIKNNQGLTTTTGE
ncbi:uncharacterized protein LOC126293519 isoform X1 [Schistocerca gregaria]|uniref:uncharacterized protein LOC126293519 isoform X1 n=2 Tax=Schistocerca gregaria TaxID=7010 RepID=UPI00211E8141|nr:uncharacterized protein LOC126293519 isoform X1 [Schistocerca gregaria]